MTKNNSVLVIFNDLTEFYAIQPDIYIMIKSKIPINIFIVPSYSEAMYQDTKTKILSLGYKIVDNTNQHYKISLEPYPLIKDINADFRIKYQYGLTVASLKPNPVYTPEWNLPYDAIVCYSFAEEDIFSLYTKSFLIKPLQFNNFKPHKKGKGLNILVLFTWGNSQAIESLRKIKEELGGQFNLIIKSHHAVQYRPDHKGVSKELERLADEYYDATANVNLLFQKADIVLSDGSSAIFTAIYLGIPVAIFSDKYQDKHELGGLKPAHVAYLIEQNLIPYTDNPGRIKETIELALKNMKRQNEIKNKQFPFDIKRTLADIVEEYLPLDRKQEPYYMLRDMLKDMLQKQRDQREQQARQITKMQSEISNLSTELNSHFDVKRSAKLFLGNIKRRLTL